MKLLNILLFVVWSLSALIHFIMQTPVPWWVAGLMATALAVHAVSDALND